MPHEKDGKVQLFINIVSITTVLGTVSAQKKKLEWERSVGMRKKENKNKMKSFQKNKKPRALAENARVLKVHRNLRILSSVRG